MTSGGETPYCGSCNMPPWLAEVDCSIVSCSGSSKLFPIFPITMRVAQDVSLREEKGHLMDTAYTHSAVVSAVSMCNAAIHMVVVSEAVN